MKKVLLLNPPGDKYFIRDYYCSHISKGRYYWPSLDLLVLSGILKNDCNICVLDALIQRIDLTAVYKFIGINKPDFLICMTAAVSWHKDISFLSGVKKYVDTSIVISGDYALSSPGKIIENYPFIDAVLLDFTDNDILEFIAGRKSSLRNIFTRFDNSKTSIVKEESFAFPVPQHNLFSLKRYHLPHIYYHPFATIMTDFGCPFQCAYCPFERIEYKVRMIDNIIEELKYIVSLGVREVWLRDQSFGSVKRHAISFCEALQYIPRPLLWSCEMRVDAADEELLKKMKKNGCHTVMFGVETANENVLRMHNKHITRAQVKQAFNSAKKIGLKTLAHFILGLKGEDMISQRELIDFCLELEPDYASFNIAAPLWNTSFREEVIRNKWLIDDNIEIDSSCSYPVWETSNLKREDVWKLRTLALRKFYLRPSYILYQLAAIKSFYRFYTLFKEGIYFIDTLTQKM